MRRYETVCGGLNGQSQGTAVRFVLKCLPMASLRHTVRLTLVLACVSLVGLLAGCSDDPELTSTSAPRQVERTPGTSPAATATPAIPSAATLRPTPVALRLPTEPLPTASLSAVQARPLLPTPHAATSAWARGRLDAVVSLYRPTPAGEALLRSLDFRQMPGEPGFFGSYGFDGWAGVGEAKPIGVMHELSHSYWGGFPVIGRPELSWQRRDGEAVSPALDRYHQDILIFMAQPPDDYEFLRERLRNLPELSGENATPLLHSLEADVAYMTGGDLSLLPPVLRKYWALFLAEGQFGSWERAMAWFQSLSPEERAIAGKFLGFEHFDLRQYPDLPAFSPSGGLLTTAAGTLAAEERQRLTDLAEQFDLLLGNAQLEEDFQFWRGYLQDKVTLYRSHPGHLHSLGLPRARELSDALEFLSGMEGSPESRAGTLAQQLSIQPVLVNFLPAVDDPTLVKLFADGPVLPDAPTLQATASFVERLRRFAALVDGILAKGRQSPRAGARALEEFLADTGYEREHDLKLFFDLLNGTDHETARRIMSQMDKATVRALMPPAPIQLRAILQPEGMLEKLDITANAAEADLHQGIGLLIQHSSGNYRIDEPFLERLYKVMEERTRTRPGESLRVMAETPFPLEGMILRQPDAASAALSGDIGLAVKLVKESDPVLAPPARIIHRLIAADPSLAARLVAALDQWGESLLVAESLAYFAYDKARSERYPQLPLSVSRDGDFLHSLLAQKGSEWLSARLASAVELYRRRAASSEVAPNFLNHYRDTLEAAATTQGADAGRRLAEIIGAAFD